MKIIVILALVSVTGLATWLNTAYNVPKEPVITSSSLSIPETYIGVDQRSARFLDDRGRINILVWNLYKQHSSSVLNELTTYAKDQQLIVLQEVKLSSSFMQFIKRRLGWLIWHTDAWEYRQEKHGVLTAARVDPDRICAYLISEPWLRLPKSSMLSFYPLSSGELLAVANIHAINFTWNLDKYRDQIATLTQQLYFHGGPIIMAGDFNSWSKSRLMLLGEICQRLHLKEVGYNEEWLVKKFLSGVPLDHIFYRGLVTSNAWVESTKNSDHSPLFARFSTG